MTTKQQLLELFEANREVYFSGEEIAVRLKLSRTAVWKAVSALRGEGYEIFAASGRGYCLSAKNDIISEQGIKKYLKNPEREITVLARTSSTNAVARELAAAGAAEGSAVIAGEQDAGRGRMGRGFFSPPGTGIYLSLLLRPAGFSAQRTVKITTIAAVAMCEAIEAVSPEHAGIKWVNDIFVRGKKVCGILTEASFGLEDGAAEYAVLGAGVNVYVPEGGFPPELSEVAGAVLERRRDDIKNRLAAEFINRFDEYYFRQDGKAYSEKYRQRSLVTGRRVKVITPAGSEEALALGIDEECRLLVKYDDGSTRALSSGEISVRL